MSLYGKVVDENGEPLEGAVATIRIVGTNPWYSLGYFFVESNNSRKIVRIDSSRDGMFQVENEHGTSIYIDTITSPNRYWLYHDGGVG